MRLRVLLSEPGATYDGMAGHKLRALGITSEEEQSEGMIFKKPFKFFRSVDPPNAGVLRSPFTLRNVKMII